MNPTLLSKLRHLRLSGMAEALPARLTHRRRRCHLEFLELLVEDELRRRADRLFSRRLEAEALRERKQLVQRLTKIDLLLIEDFGMKRLGPTAAEDLLEVFVRRHEKASTVVTTNRPTQDWGAFLGDVPAATAILDRFLAQAEIIQMQGKSYRMHQRAERAARANAAQA